MRRLLPAIFILAVAGLGCHAPLPKMPATSRTELPPAPRISGTVRYPSGAPAPGVLVSFHPGQYPGASEYAEVKTDPNGQYELVLQRESGQCCWIGPMAFTNFILARNLERNLAAIHEFSMATNFGTNLLDINSMAKAPARVDLILQPGITLSGSVKDTQASPVTNAAIELRFLSGDSLPKVVEEPLTVNAHGLFSIPALPQGREYFIWKVNAKGFGSAYGHVEAKNTKTNRYEFPPLVLKLANRRLAGRVVDNHGEPLPVARVSFAGTGQPQDSGTNTDSQGNFAFDGVCDGPLTISASYLDPKDSDIFMSLGGGGTNVHAGDTNILIQLRDTTFNADAPILITKGTVFDPFGKPDSGVSLAVWRSENPFLNFTTDSGGKYRVRWQRIGEPADRKSILVARDTEHNFAATHFLQETTTKLNLHLQSGCTLSGVVQDGDGKPLTNATVTLDLSIQDAGVRLAQTQVDTNASFLFGALPRQGDYRLEASVPDRPAAAVTTNFASAGQSIRLPPFRLPLANLRVAGIAVYADGKPAPDVALTIKDHDQMSLGDTKTDAQGRFVFDRATKGPIWICGLINKGNMDGYNCNPFITVQAGETNIIFRLVVAATHSAMEAWQCGDKPSVIADFLKVDWTVRPLFDSYRALSLSEDQFVALPQADREAHSKEIMAQMKSFRKLLAAVSKAGHDAAAKGNVAQAREIFTSLKQCGSALDSRDCLQSLQNFGKHLKNKADAALHSLGCGMNQGS